MTFRLEPFPLRHAMRASQHRERARHMRLCGRSEWWEEDYRRWATVSLALTREGWALAYDGKPSTGPFKDKQAAVAWYASDGR